MGNSYSSKKCIECKLSVGDYSIDYMCHITGKGKWNNVNMCAECLYDRINKKKKNKRILKNLNFVCLNFVINFKIIIKL